MQTPLVNLPVVMDLPMKPLIELLAVTLAYLPTVVSMEGGLLMNEPNPLIDQMPDLEELQRVVRSNSPK